VLHVLGYSPCARNRSFRGLSLNVLCACALGALVGCSSHDGAAGPADAGVIGSELEGIYQIQTYTHNEQSCTEEGQSVLEQRTERFLFVVSSFVLGRPYVMAASCVSVDDCRGKLARARAMEASLTEFSLGFTTAIDDHTVGGRGVDTGSSGAGAFCTDSKINDHALARAADKSIRIEDKITIVGDHPKDSDGSCSSDGTLAAAVGKSCSQLDALTAQFIE
jgi:hypothetical protein